MSLETDLRAVWDRYDSQHAAERHAAETAQRAARELFDLNRKRAASGLAPVGEFRDQGSIMQAQAYQQFTSYSSQPKTWRDEMDAELLSTIRRHFT